MFTTEINFTAHESTNCRQYPSYAGDYALEDAALASITKGVEKPSQSVVEFHYESGVLRMKSEITLTAAEVNAIAWLANQYKPVNQVVLTQPRELTDEFDKYARKGQPFIASAAQLQAQFWGM